MANILFITQTTTHRTATYYKTVIESFAEGHTVTLVASSTITNSAALDGYDLIICSRVDIAHTTAMAPLIRGKLDIGVPCFFNFLEINFTTGNTFSSTLIKKLNIVLDCHCNTTLYQSPYILDSGDELLSGVTGLPKTSTVLSSNTFLSFEWSDTSVATVGTILITANNTDRADRGFLIKIPKNTLDLTSTNIGAKVICAGFLYSTGTVTMVSDYQTILRNCINWLLTSDTTTVTLEKFESQDSAATTCILGAVSIEKILTGDALTASSTSTEAGISKIVTLESSTDTTQPTSANGAINLGATVTLTGGSSTMAPTASQAAVNLVKTLTGTTSTSTPTTTSDSVTLIKTLTGLNSSLATTSSDGSVSTSGSVELTGINLVTITNSPLGAISQIHQLTGTSNNMTPNSTQGALGSVVELTGGGISATANLSIGAVAVFTMRSPPSVRIVHILPSSRITVLA